MKKLMIAAAALMISLSAYGQGSFIFNTHDTAAGSVVQFKDASGLISGSTEYFIQVYANGAAVGDPMFINGTGARAGYPNPFSQTISSASLAAGPTPISYQVWQGSSLASGKAVSDMISKNLTDNSALTVNVVLAPTPPNEVVLGTGAVTINVPEPATLALGLLGVGALLAFRRRQ